jgi:hypothetical protein
MELVDLGRNRCDLSDKTTSGVEAVAPVVQAIKASRTRKKKALAGKSRHGPATFVRCI